MRRASPRPSPILKRRRVRASAVHSSRRGSPNLAGINSDMTHFGKSFVVKGALSADEDLRFDGTLIGHLDVDDATLILGDTATVDADIRAKQVIVQGAVQGSIAGNRIELTATARVRGSLTAERIVIAEGAHFSGDVYMGRRTIARIVAQYRAAQAAARL